MDMWDVLEIILYVLGGILALLFAIALIVVCGLSALKLIYWLYPIFFPA